MRIPEMLLRCPVFLGCNRDPEDHKTAVFFGTGFLVCVQDDGFKFNYIATAKHVVEDMRKISKHVPKSTFVRLNDAGGTARQFSLAGTTWIHSDDPMVDLAVCPIEGPNMGRNVIPTTSFADPSLFSEWGIGPGDEVFSVGLFTEIAGNEKNYPMVRYGNIAMLPDSPVLTALGYREVYLIEARSIGGLSGAPVFVRETLWLDPETLYRAQDEPRSEKPPMLAVGRTFLLGVMRGHWDIDPDTMGAMYPTGKPARQGGVNMGIAMVTPATKLKKLLYEPALSAHRDTLKRKTD